jgi:hypothetical protein
MSWDDFFASTYAKTFVPLDPYEGAHGWDKFGHDIAGVTISHPEHSAVSIDHSSISSTTVSMPPVVPALTPELAALVKQRREQALARRQAHLLTAPVVHLPHSEVEDSNSELVVLPGLTSCVCQHTSTTRYRFKFGKTTASEARAATAAVQSQNPSKVLHTSSEP